MKHLLIEAPDRCGKDTLIKNLMPYCQNLVVTHFSTPTGNTDQEKKIFQQLSFREEFKRGNWLLKSDFFGKTKMGKMNLLIWNRAHLGEFVYGNLYRQTQPEQWVMQLEQEYEYDQLEEVYLLLLTASPEFLSKNDDGESFSSTSESREMEIQNFKYAFNLSKIKKKLEINVEENGQYISEKEITYRVLHFLNK